MKIPVTNNWMQSPDEVIGLIEFADTAKAHFLYEMLKMRPDSFRFEIGYQIDEGGKYHLTEVSLINKYPEYHPIIVSRRLKDRLTRLINKIG